MFLTEYRSENNTFRVNGSPRTLNRCTLSFICIQIVYFIFFQKFRMLVVNISNGVIIIILSSLISYHTLPTSLHISFILFYATRYKYLRLLINAVILSIMSHQGVITSTG